MNLKYLQQETWQGENIIAFGINKDKSLPFKYYAQIKEGQKTFKTYFNTIKDLNIQYFNN